MLAELAPKRVIKQLAVRISMDEPALPYASQLALHGVRERLIVEIPNHDHVCVVRTLAESFDLVAEIGCESPPQ